jgi:hypothetical protein
MAFPQWQFQLVGDALDIDSLTELFGDKARFVKDAWGHTNLRLELPFPMSESEAAADVAEELIAKMNGIAQILYGNHDNVRIASVGCQATEGGPMHFFGRMHAGIRGRGRASASLTDATAGPMGSPAEPPKRIGDAFLAVAEKDEHLDRALYLFGSLPQDWRGLYMVLEAAEDAHGGESGLTAKRFVPDGQIKAFKATANSYRALRLAARHGSLKQGVDQAKMTVQQAREMMRTILEGWAKAVA